MGKIELFTLELDLDNAIKTTSEFKSEADALKAELQRLKKAGKDTTEEFVKVQAQYNNVNKEYRTSQKELTNLVALQGKQINTVKEARQALSVLNKRWAEAASIYGENSEEASELEKETLRLTNALKEQEKKVGDNRRNVGNYTESIESALKSTSIFSKEISLVVEVLNVFTPAFKVLGEEAFEAGKQILFASRGTEGLSKAQKASAIATNLVSGALKLFRIALISTGIGAIVVLLGSLVAYFSSTQKGIDAVNSALTPLKVVFESLFGVLQQLGEALASVFTTDGISNFGQLIEDLIIRRVDQAKRAFSALNKIITFDFKEGFNDLKSIGGELIDEVEEGINSIKKVGDQLNETIREAWERGQQIAALQIEIEENEISLIQNRARLNLLTKEQNKIAEDITKTDKERIAAAQLASKAQQDLLKIETELLDKKIAQLKLEQQSNDTTRADLKELAELEAERFDKATQNAEIQTTLQNKLNTILEQRQAAARKASEERIKDLETELAFFEASTSSQAKNAEDKLAFEKEILEREIDILQQAFDLKLLKENEFNLKVQNIRNEIRNLENTYQEEELDRLNTFEERRQDLIDELYLRRLEGEEEKELARAEMDILAQEAELENLQLTEDQKTELLALIEENRGELLSEIRKKFQDKNLKDFEAFLKADVAARKQNASEVAGIAKSLTGILRGLLGDSLGAQLAGIAIDAAIEAAKVSITSSSAQAANIAQATATAPPPANLPFIAAATAQNVSLAAQSSAAISKILASAALTGLGATVSKLEKGGNIHVGGRSHAQGGTKFYGEDGTVFEAEKGEVINVLNKDAAAAYLAFNNRFNGPRGASSINYAASGAVIERGVGIGGASRSTPGSQNLEPLADKIVEGIADLNISVAVTEINDGQSNFAEVVNGADL